MRSQESSGIKLVIRLIGSKSERGKDFEEIQEFTDLSMQRIQELASTMNV